MKKDKIQDSICCISIATLIGGVAEAALGQWWLIVIAIVLIVFSLWWMLTASTSIEAEAGRCKVNFNGPLKWIDTHFKENALLPVMKGYIIKPQAIPGSEWAKYVEEAKQTMRNRVGNIDEEFLETFDEGVILQKIETLMINNVGEYMKFELARERHRVDLETDESDIEHPYTGGVLYSPIPFRTMLNWEPSSITVDNYPGQEGIDVKIRTLECAMIGMPVLQSTIPFIIVLPWLSILEKIISEIVGDERPVKPMGGKP